MSDISNSKQRKGGHMSSLTRVFYTEENGDMEQYCPEKHLDKVRKFLFFHEEDAGGKSFLVCGSIDFHKRLYGKWADTLTRSQRRAAGDLVGAGTMQHGEIVNWESMSFRHCTPEHWKRQIMIALGL